MGVRDMRAWLLSGPVILFITLTAVLSFSAFSGGAGASNKRIITVYADGEKQTVLTEEATVGEAITKADIKLNEKDLVEPARDTPINSDVFKINVYRARPYTIVDGDKEIDVFSAYQSPRLIAEDAGIKVYQADKFDVDRIDNIVATQMLGQRIRIVRATPVKLVIYGEEFTHRTHAKTVGEVLAEKEIKIEESDLLAPKADQAVKSGMTIHVIRVDGSVEVVEEPIPFETERIYNSDMEYGQTKVEQAGSNGSKIVTYELVMHDGAVVDRMIRQSIEVTPAVKEVVVVGNKYDGDFAGGAWAQLRACEAGGAYDRNSGNGYYGAYQFNPGTWAGYAPEPYKNVLPHLAPPSAQDTAAQNLYNVRGWQPWPGCRAKLNLP